MPVRWTLLWPLVSWLSVPERPQTDWGVPVSDQGVHHYPAVRTTSLIRPGKEIADLPTDISPKEMVETLKKVCGTIERIPPAFSAIQSWRKTRLRPGKKGMKVWVKTQDSGHRWSSCWNATCHQNKMVVCSLKGTYIRALARDIGQALQSGAHLTGLIRTRVGEVNLEDCIRKWDSLKPGWPARNRSYKRLRKER